MTIIPAVEKELAIIAIEPKARLRERYIALFERHPPKAFGPDLLRRSVAQRLQENAYGALSKGARRELDRLVAAFIAKPDGRVVMTRTAQFGTVLVRQWKDKSYRVGITEDGFTYEGRPFTNLSEIARLITGTRWNGPRFFGLRQRKALEQSDQKAGLTPTVAAGATRSSDPLRRRMQHGL